MKKLLLLLPLLLVVFTSGCTDLCIPGLMECGTVNIQEENVFIFESITISPQKISSGQGTQLIASIKNTINERATMSVELYDDCGLFEDIAINCPGDPTTNTYKCQNIQVFGLQRIPIIWDMIAKPLEKIGASCRLKLKLNYSTSTKSSTSISFVTQDELLRRIQEGEARTVTSSMSIGSGPIRPYFDVKSEQPISTQSSNALVWLSIKNVGRGHPVENKIYENQLIIYAGHIENDGNTGEPITDSITGNLTDCKSEGYVGPNEEDGDSGWFRGEIKNGEEHRYIQLVAGEETILPCSIELSALKREDRDEVTQYLTVELKDYEYELLGHADIEIDPIITVS